MNYKKIEIEGEIMFIDMSARRKKCIRCGEYIRFGIVGVKYIPVIERNGKQEKHFKCNIVDRKIDVGADMEHGQQRNRDFLNNL